MLKPQGPSRKLPKHYCLVMWSNPKPQPIFTDWVSITLYLKWKKYTQPTLQDSTGYIDNAPCHSTVLGDYKASIQVVYLPSSITPVMQLTDEV